MSALVLDGQLKSALCAVRVLGERGVGVVAAAERSSAAALHSRYTKERLVYPSPKRKLEAYIAWLKSTGAELMHKSNTKIVVYAFSDATYLPIVRHWDELSKWYEFPHSSLASIETAFNKRTTYALARECSVPTITTYDVTEATKLTYPVVIKTVSSVIWTEVGSTSGTAEFIFSAEDLQRRHQALIEQTGEVPLIQEFITGAEYGVEFLCDRGDIVRRFAHKRIRSLSPRGGASVVKETASDSPEVQLMLQYATTLVGALSWTGPIMVEFKIDDRDGSVKLMEINGRFVGSLPLPQRAGSDFVGGYYELATGGVAATPPPHCPRTGRYKMAH